MLLAAAAVQLFSWLGRDVVVAAAAALIQLSTTFGLFLAATK